MQYGEQSKTLVREPSNLPKYSRKFTKYFGKRKTSMFSKYANQSRTIWNDLSTSQRLVLVIWWLTVLAFYVTMNLSYMCSYHLSSSTEDTSTFITTYDTSKMFYNSKSYVLFALYVNGCYIQPFVHLTMLIFITFFNFTPKRKRYFLDRMRFSARFTILPIFTLLFMTFAVDRHVEGFLEASVYISPTTGYYIQLIAGPALILLETWVIRLNDCAAPDIQNVYITRLSLFASGASVVCFIAFLWSDIMEVEILGLLRTLMSETDDPFVHFVDRKSVV